MVDEILVHISAPTTNQTDNIYQSLADEYLKFEPYHPNEIYENSNRSSQEVVPATPDLNLGSSAPKRDAVPAQENGSIVTTSKSSYGSFPSFIPSGILELDQDSASHDSVADHVGPTSSRLARLDTLQRHWKDHKTPKSGSGRRSLSAKEVFGSGEPETKFIEDTQVAARTLQSQLQDGYSSTEEDTAISDSFVHGNLETGTFTRNQEGDDGHETAGEVGASPHSRVIGFAPSDPAGITGSHRTCELDSSQNEFDTTIDEVALPQDNDFLALPLAVFPPAPPISTERPTSLPSQITSYLASLKAQNPTRFNASGRGESPSPDERGYWNVECSHWPPELQLELWSSLCENIKEGRLGWGVSLHRIVKDGAGVGDIRVYCWAEIVEHIWLVLWLCSKGRVSTEKTKWFGAGGEILFGVDG